MKWFKHLTKSKSDPDIQESEIRFKSQGPYVFWRMLEIMSAEDATDKPLIMNFEVFRNWFPSVTRPKLMKILSYFQHKSRIKWKLNEDDIEIFCFKLSDISSDYSAKVRSKSKVTSKLLRKMSETEVEVDLKKKKEKKNKKELSRLDSALQDFGKMRKELKAPLTERAKKMLLTKLEKLSTDEDTQIKIIEQSIFHNWKDVYEIKTNDKQYNRFNQKLDTNDLLKENMELDLE